VPNGIFPVPQFHSDPTTGAPRVGLITRARTRWRRGRLDEQLVRGIDPETSVELRLRAAQLSSHSGRARLANALVERLGDARGPNLRGFPMRTIRQDAAIREAADDLLALVLRLRDERPVELRGAAVAARLVYGKDSPLHHDNGPELKDALRAARAALDAPAPAPAMHGLAAAA
jgi:hypothetical protein